MKLYICTEKMKAIYIYSIVNFCSHFILLHNIFTIHKNFILLLKHPSASASASVQCRAFYSVVHRERDLVALAKEGFEALNCLCMHDRCF